MDKKETLPDSLTIFVTLAVIIGTNILSGCGSSDEEDADGGRADASMDAGAYLDSQVPGVPGSDGGGASEQDLDDAGEEITCGMSPFEATRRRVNVLLMIDKSGSMAYETEGFETDKWSALKSALEAVLNDAKNDIAFGLELFPMSGTCGMAEGDAITLHVRAGGTSVPRILDILDIYEPSGDTPTALALEHAYEYFTEGHGSQLRGDKYIMLATDGGPNCNLDITCEAERCTANMDGICPVDDILTNCCDPDQTYENANEHCLDDARTLARIQDLAKAGIKTFVVGIPGSEVYAEALNKFAEAGKAVNPDPPPSYFAAAASDGVEGLISVLKSITTELITSCRLQLASYPLDIQKLNVEVDGELVPQAGGEGWEIDMDTDPPTIVIKGKTCEKIETEGAETVKVVYGCPTLE
jgi:hypothetical protein